MAREDNNSQDSLLEDLGVISAAGAAGIGGAALFFRNTDNPGRLNDAVLKAGVYFREAVDMWDRYGRDLTQLNASKFEEARNNVEERFKRLHDSGASFKLSNTPFVSQLQTYYQKRFDRDTLIRNVWFGDATRAAIETFESLDIKDRDVRGVVMDILPNIAKNSADVNKAYRQISTRIKDPIKRQQAQDYVDQIFKTVRNWQEENPLKEESGVTSYWVDSRGAKVVDSYLSMVKSTTDQMLEDQRLYENSLLGKFEDFIFGKNSSLTVADIARIETSGTDAEKDELNRLFRNSRTPITSNENLTYGTFTSDINSEQALKEIRESRNNNTKVFNTKDLILTHYKGLSDEEKRDFGKLKIWGVRYGRDGKLHSTADLSKFIGDFFYEAGQYTPANLFHPDDFIFNIRQQPTVSLSKIGTYDFSLGDILGIDPLLKEQIAYNNGRVYILDGNEYRELKDLRGKLFTYSTKTGVPGRLSRAMAGATPEPVEWMNEALGLNIEYRPDIKEAGNNADLYGNFSQENLDKLQDILDRYTNPTDINSAEDINAYNRVAGLDRYLNFLRKNTQKVDINDVRRIYAALKGQASESNSIGLLEQIIKLHENPGALEEIIGSLSGAGVRSNKFNNPYLNMTLQAYAKDPQKAMAVLNTLRDPEGFKKGSYTTLNYIENLQRELMNEFFSRYQEVNGRKFNDVLGMLEDILGRSRSTSLRDLATVFEYNKKLEFPSLTSTEEDIQSSVEVMEKVVKGYKNILNDDSESGKALRNSLTSFNNRFNADFNELGEDIRGYARFNIADRQIARRPFLFVNNPLNIIKDINEGQFNKAFGETLENIYGFGAQFFAGRGSKYFSGASFLGSHLVYRLNDMLNVDLPFGIKAHLGVKNADTMSGGAVFKNLLTKRVAPVVGAYYAFDFIDDVLKSTTGMGGYEAMASGAANNYLLLKKASDAIGLTSGLKSLTQDNAIAEYFAGYFGDENPEWNSYEEQVKYYQSGYSAIRKARFWTFGSSNEFRGGRISYWEPNTLRLLASDYRDESLYNGSFWTKWNPFQILDPYYIEHLHYEDRPYPVSGSLFADSTPWGIVLNATIGEIYKPKIRMHEDRLVGGVDVKALIYHMNAQIHNKARENEAVFYVDRGRLKSMAFDAYNAPTYSERIVSVDNEGNITANDYGQYNTALPIEGGVYSELVNSAQEFRDPRLSVRDKIAILAARGNPLAQMGSALTGAQALSIIRQNNAQIYQKAGYAKSQGILREEKLNQYNAVDELLDNSDLIEELLTTGSTNDYVQQMAISSRMLGGIYGWMASNAIGYGDNKYDRIATSADIYGFSRRFWDSGIGGFGGDVMEIVRRVIPEYRRYQTYNPLMNTMPDWLPEKFRFGDAYTSVPNGEARLPGRGYESLNELHPDIFGRYGAFDRFKVLADIAPYSAEYKFWKRVVQKTVKDPELQEEIQAIKDRVAEQSRQHDFQPYKYVGRGVDTQEAVITEVLSNGQFKIFGTDQVYKLSGVRVKANENENGQEVLSRYLTPGMTVRLVVDENERYARNRDVANSINAGVVVGGESISQMMLQAGDAVTRKSDVSAAAYMANHGTFVNTINYLSEAFMHADIPVLHNRWFRANDPLEDYQDEYLYGTSFQSWDDVYETFIIPNMRKAAASEFWTGAGILSDILFRNINEGTDDGRNVLATRFQNWLQARERMGLPKGTNITNKFNQIKVRHWAQNVNIFSDRGALMGRLTAKVLKLTGDSANTLGERMRKGGSLLTLGYAAAVNENSLPLNLMVWSRLGWRIGEHFGDMRGKMSLIGAGIGALRWASSINLLSENNGIDEQYIPESAKKRWELQDYFDRLTYLKYMALYNEAADRAEDEEGVDIRRIIELQDKEYRQIREAKQEIEDELADIGTPRTVREEELARELRKRRDSISPTRIPLKGGEYAKSAIMYYNAARSTMYGLDETSSMADIVRALPKTDRDYFMEFVKERDDEKRKEILSYVSPQLQKALRMIWYGEFEKPESMEDYFDSHILPAPTWGGWNPNVDLADVMAKVVKNEAMTASDFGIYSSQYNEPEVINAPELNIHGGGDSYLMASLKLKTLLNGYGFIGTEVSVEPRQDDLIQVVSNIARVVPYNIEQGVEELFGGF